MKYLFIWIALAAAWLPAASQTGAERVDGIVVAPGNKTVPNAEVSCGGQVATRTLNDGTFSFAESSCRSAAIDVHAAGFHPVSVPVQEKLAITLVPLPVLETSIQVAGVTESPVQVDLPVRTEVISSQLCERNVLRNLSEVLSSGISGVRVDNSCNNCGVTSLRINGLEGPYVQILEDGLPTYSGVSLVYALDQIPAEFVDSVEIVKGGGSAVYGPGAIAGVVNLVRRTPVTNRARLTTETGWHQGRPLQTYNLTAQRSGLKGGFAADLYAMAQRRTSVDRNGDGFTESGKRLSSSAGGALFKKFADGAGRLSFGGGLIAEDRRGGDLLHLAPEETNITEMATSRRSSLFVRASLGKGRSLYSTAVSASNLSRSTYYGTGGDPNAYGNTRNPVVASDLQIAVASGRHSIVAGHQFLRDQVSDRQPAYGRTLLQTSVNNGLYVQDEYRVLPGLVMTAGLRADRHNLVDGWQLNPRGNLRWEIVEGWSVRGGYTSGFRPPAIFDEDLHVAAVGGEGLVLRNDPGLRPERARSVSFSVDHQRLIGGGMFEAGITLYSTSLDGVHWLEEVESGGDWRTLARVNGPGAMFRGVSGDVRHRFTSRLALRGGITFQSATYADSEPQFGSRRLFRTPRRHGYTGADIELPSGVSLSLTSDFNASMLVPHYAGYIDEDRLEVTPAFAVFNAVLSRTFDLASDRKVRFYAKAANLGNSFQRDLDRGPRRDAGYFYGPLTMREVAVGLSFSF